MDPNVTYDQLCDLANQALAGGSHDAVRIAELFESLDLWIRNGGFLPASWQPSSH